VVARRGEQRVEPQRRGFEIADGVEERVVPSRLVARLDGGLLM
jgi:hypothetical protein